MPTSVENPGVENSVNDPGSPFPNSANLPFKEVVFSWAGESSALVGLANAPMQQVVKQYVNNSRQARLVYSKKRDKLI